MSECLKEDELFALARGTITDPGRRQQLHAHIDRCGSCRRVLGEALRFMAGESAAPADDTATLRPGQQVGRYVLERPLGAGSEATVFAAFDPALRRRVAIKLMRDGHAGAPDADRDPARARRLNEAWALARLTHPNVIAVHDVGTFGGGVFIVMEYVDGQTLTTWMSGPHDGRETVRLFEQVARGLAAAHDAGIIHGDTKPDNILLDVDLRPRVADFGLAADDDETDNGDAHTPAAGTRLFMAPERPHTRRPTAAADQWSFAMSLHVALFGHAPERPDLRLGVPAKLDERLARRLRDFFARALAPDPTARFSDMHAVANGLAAALAARARARTRLLWTTAGTLGLATATFAWLWVTRPPTDRAADGTFRPPFTGARRWCDDEERSTTNNAGARFCSEAIASAGPWAAARSACLERGAALVICDSEASCEPREARLPLGAPHWNGLGWDGRRQRYVWLDGNRSPPPYLLQARGLPANPDVPDGCVAMVRIDDRRVSWQLRPCASPAAALCEAEPFVQPLDARSAYRLLSVPIGWDEAQTICERQGGHLAVIDSPEKMRIIEATFLNRHAGNTAAFWIGATDRAREGEFRWVTGHALSFAPFHRDEPDNRDGAQHCLVVDTATRRWHDRNCETPEAALCEFPLNGP